MKTMMTVALAMLGLSLAAQDSTDQQSGSMRKDSTRTMNSDRTNTTNNNGSGMNNMDDMPDKVGNMSAKAFMAANKKGGDMVAAIKPTKTPLSAADKKLMLEVAAGGQRQLAISQAVLDKVTNPQVRMLAQSEVEEQTGVAAKLKEIATAKNVTLPEGPADSVLAMVSNVQSMSGEEVDAFYINESGVKGHQLLQKTMTKVNSTAKDAGMKKLASATLPVIRMHLTVSRDLQRTMGTNRSAAR